MNSDECLICGKNCIAESHEHCDGRKSIEIGSAVHFRATGNWASSVWDPLNESLSLHIFICDDCLKERKARATVAIDRYEGWVRSREVRFDEWEKGVGRPTRIFSFKCSCGGDMETVPAGLDDVIRCNKCFRIGPRVKKVQGLHPNGMSKDKAGDEPPSPNGLATDS